MKSIVGGDWRTEEDVKIKFLLPFLRERGYMDECFSFNEGIEIQEGRKRKTIFPDVVVYASRQKTAPLVLCETKAPTELLDRFAKEQAISYARLLPRIAPIALITNGHQVQVFQALNKNRIPELPHRSELRNDLVNFIVSREVQDALRTEAKHGLFIIDDVRTFKSVLKRCHNEIRNNEGYDPTVAFDEMSKVLFCKLYEEKEHPDNNRFRLAIFNDTLERLSINVVRQIFEETKKDARYANLFESTTQINLQDRTIRAIVSLFENYDLSLTAFDVKGEAFEYFLSDTFTGGLGEYFTPRNIVEFIVDAVDPKIGERIVDPFCGTGGFLIYAFEVVSEKIRLQQFSDDEKARWKVELSDRCLYGSDWKERTSQACKMNMMVHGDGSAGIFMHHGLLDVRGKIEEGQFNLCITNPPFGSVENDPDVLKKYDLGARHVARKSQSRDVLAIERSIRLVKPGGWIGIIVIDGLLNTKKTQYVRNYIKSQTWIKAVISLARETFEGYGARAKTSILLLRKKSQSDEGQQEPVFMAIAQNTGYAPNGAQIPGNELPDILLDYKAFLHGREEQRRHINTWVSPIGDRFDAKFYWPRNTQRSQDVHGIQRQIAALLAQINVEYGELEVALEQAFAEQEFTTIQLEDVLTEVSIKEPLVPGQSYRLLGVRWWGEGTFIREEKLGSDIKAGSLYRVSAGWIIYNRLFAYRGSFAIIAQEHDGGYVSGEFPTFTVRPEIDLPDLTAKYIVYCLNSPQYLDLIDALSTGSTETSRNRLSQKEFLDITVQMPSTEDGLRTLVNLLDRMSTFRIRQHELQEQIKTFGTSISMMLPSPNHSTG